MNLPHEHRRQRTGLLLLDAAVSLDEDNETVLCPYQHNLSNSVTKTNATVRMIGVAIPAHDEQACLDSYLRALLVAAGHPALHGEAVHVCVVLDACEDNSAGVVRRWQATFIAAGVALDSLEVQARRVGAARSASAHHLLDVGARWLAFTDADTRVADTWLADQLALDVDVVCGVVTVDDWSPHADGARALHAYFDGFYQDSDGHRHIHGANLGVSATAYRSVGGFQDLPCHEDVLLVRALEGTRAGFA